MIKIAIVYYSGFGHTEVQAKSVAEGVKSVPDTNVSCLNVDAIDKKLNELEKMDAIIFGSPTYMGSVAADFKRFMDLTSDIWAKQRWQNKIAAGFTNSYCMSGDKLNVLIQMAIFAAQHGMIWVGQSEPNQSPENQSGNIHAINRMGSYLGAMAQSENDTPENTPSKGDLLTAQKFGERVARVTQGFK